MNDQALTKMFAEWQSGRLENFAGVRFTGSLKDVQNHFVIVSMMPEEGQGLQTIENNSKGAARISLHVFSFIDVWPLPGGNGAVAGNIWVYGTALVNAMPFPTLEMAEEFNAKCVDMGGVEIWKVSRLIDYMRKNKIPVT